MATKTKKRGRPEGAQWKKVTPFTWQNKTNAEIAAEMGCSTVNVYLKRNRRIKAAEAKAEAKGLSPEATTKAGDAYRCKRPKFARGRHLAEASNKA